MTKQRGEAAWQHTLKANNNGGKNQYPHLSSCNFFLSRGLNVLVLQRLPSSRPLFPKGVYCVSASQNRRSKEGKEWRTRRGTLAVRNKKQGGRLAEGRWRPDQRGATLPPRSSAARRGFLSSDWSVWSRSARNMASVGIWLCFALWATGGRTRFRLPLPVGSVKREEVEPQNDGLFLLLTQRQNFAPVSLSVPDSNLPSDTYSWKNKQTERYKSQNCAFTVEKNELHFKTVTLRIDHSVRSRSVSVSLFGSEKATS